MTTRYRPHDRVRANQKSAPVSSFPLPLPHSHREPSASGYSARGPVAETRDVLAHAGPQPGSGTWSGGSAEVDVGDAGSGKAQGSAGGVGQAGQHAEGGQAAAAFDAGDRGLGGAHPPGQLGLGQSRPGPQGADQPGQL